MHLMQARLPGVLAIAAWLAVIAGPSCHPMFQSSLCEMAADAQLATPSFVRFSATLYAGANGSLVLNDPACPLASEAWASLEFDASVPANPRIAAFLRSAEQLGSLTARRAVPVTVSGTLQDNGNPCFAPRFNIQVAQIAFVGPETTVTAPLSGAFATAPSN